MTDKKYVFKVTGKKFEGGEEQRVTHRETFTSLEAVCKRFGLEDEDALISIALDAIGKRAQVSQANGYKAEGGPDKYGSDSAVKDHFKRFKPGGSESEWADLNRMTKLIKQATHTPEELEELNDLMAKVQAKTAPEEASEPTEASA